MKENKESSKDYRNNLDKKAEKGDPKAQKQKSATAIIRISRQLKTSF